MADQDELRLRIVPELDDEAVKRIKAQLDALYGGLPPGGPPPTKPGGDPDAPARKQRLADLKAEIDLRDLLIRKDTIANQNRIRQIQEEMALGRTSMQEGARLIAEQENLREQAAADAVVDYQKQIALAEELNLTLSERASIERKAFFASERAKNGFTTMSGSMTTLTSNTKSANIAFANFGRIVQDAPFGLLGISNNIDPLLNSFRQLKQETNGTGGALLAMGKQLLGPAGLIFLLGSALPTALLFLQKHLQDNKKESDAVADAIKRVRDEFAKLSAQAAGDEGLESVTSELKANNAALATINSSLSVYAKNQREISDLQQRDVVTLNGVVTRNQLTIEQRERLNQLIRENQSINKQQLETDKAIIESSNKELEITKAQIEGQDNITAARRRYGIAVALTAKEEEEANKKNNETLIARLQVIDPLIALQLTFNDAIRESRDAYLAQAAAARIASMAEERSFQERVKREAGRGRDTTLTDDADYERAIEQRNRLEQIRIDTMRRLGQEEEAITLETEIRKRDAVMSLLKLGITDRETIGQELANIEKDGAERIKENELTIADARAEAMRIYADTFASGIEAVFGRNKAIQSAQVIIDTYAGAQKAFAALAPNIPLQIAASGAVVAQGIAALRKINSTTKNTRSISRSGTASSASPQNPRFVTDVGAAGQIAGTIGPFGASMTPRINITANLDRQGLALAVRDGEADIATRQIPFAS